MLSKSITDRSAPHLGSSRSTKCRYALTRSLVIHSGSDLCAEISRTTSSSKPRRVRKTEVTSSWKPNLYSPTVVAASSCSVNCAAVIGRRSRLDACQPPWFETTCGRRWRVSELPGSVHRDARPCGGHTLGRYYSTLSHPQEGRRPGGDRRGARTTAGGYTEYRVWPRASPEASSHARPPPRKGAPMSSTTALVRHRVANYDAWKTEYDSFAPIQAKNGDRAHQVLRSQDNTNDVVITHTFDDLGKAKAFFAMPEIKQAMSKAG